jgi:hypothetical protein
MTQAQGRALGQIETSMALMHELNGSTQTASLLSFAGALTQTQLLRAAETLHNRHPMLRSRIIEQAQALHFKVDVPFTQIQVQSQPLLAGATPAELLQHQLDNVLDPQRELWRLLLLSAPEHNQHHLLLTCHHAISDAASLVQLLGELLQLCESQQLGTPLNSQEVPLAAALDDHQDLATQLPVACETPPPVPFAQAAALVHRRTGVRRLLLDGQTSNQLQRLAKANGLSLNALLAGALLKAAGELELGEQIRINSAVSLRQRAARPISAQAIGCFIGVASHCLPVTGRSLLNLAADYQRQLQASLPAQSLRLPVQSLESLRVRTHALRSQTGFLHGIALTNHGAIGFPQYRYFRLLDYANAASRVAGNFAVALHVTRFAGALSLCFTFPVPLMDEALINRLQLKLQQSLLRFTSATEVAP